MSNVPSVRRIVTLFVIRSATQVGVDWAEVIVRNEGLFMEGDFGALISHLVETEIRNGVKSPGSGVTGKPSKT